MSKLHCLRSRKNLVSGEETYISRGCFRKVSRIICLQILVIFSIYFREFRDQHMLFNVYVAFLQYLQYVYQKGRHFKNFLLVLWIRIRFILT